MQLPFASGPIIAVEKKFNIEKNIEYFSSDCEGNENGAYGFLLTVFDIVIVIVLRTLTSISLNIVRANMQ